ncbi:hypothetical protein BGZ60DRAFT_414301 [Tricladium varicosporioides]|nr:hypothetical protein BGZ60DRAFT_414301 [Hymenoscyphus varicosporioides]
MMGLSLLPFLAIAEMIYILGVSIGIVGIALACSCVASDVPRYFFWHRIRVHCVGG